MAKKSDLRKEIDGDLSEVNNKIKILDRQYRLNEIDKNTYIYAHGLLEDNRKQLLRIMEICVVRNRF